ncbi:Ileal sodium/bile acid cotransporter [Holothuria leucospilota]|uniref:Ileal sodium/bile acid cotransporter n=1 Tax=Holothuria leucospilota TaxID=206669 RepID=A0A9Q1CLV4_HOLLE|nr:Ileal sodium/bile acid cotransporter [Holothuria leucospilota]
MHLERITQSISLVCEGIALFGVGCRLHWNQFLDLEKPAGVGLFLQTMILPFVGYVMAAIFRLETLDALAVILTATAPIAGYSSVLTYWASGDIALGVLLAALSTTLSIGLYPLWFYLYASTWQKDVYVIAYPLDVVTCLCIIIFPVGFGIMFLHYFPKLSPYLSKVCSCAFLVRVTVNTSLVIIYHPEQFQVDWHVWMATFLIPSIGFLLGFIAAYFLRQPYKVCVAVSMAVGASNGNLVKLVATKSIDNSTDLVHVLQLPLIYAIFAPLQGTAWAFFYRKFKRVDEDNPTMFGDTYDEWSD